MERISKFIAYQLPKRVVYFCLMRAMSYATTGKYGDTVVPGVTLREVADRWEKKS